MNDLAYTPPRVKTPSDSPMGGMTSPMDNTPQKPSYPSLRLNGPQAAAAGLTGCAHGDEYELTVRIRARKIGGDDWETKDDSGHPAVEFDVLSAEDPVEVESEEDTAADAAGPVLKAAAKLSKTRTPSPKDAGIGAPDDEEEE